MRQLLGCDGFAELAFGLSVGTYLRVPRGTNTPSSTDLLGVLVVGFLCLEELAQTI